MSRGRPACHHGIPLAYDCPYCADDDHAEEWLAWAWSADSEPEPQRPAVPMPPAHRGSWERESR